MEGFAIMMLLLSAGLLIFGALILKTGDYSMIPKGRFIKVKDPERYARQFGKVILWISIVPALASMTAFLHELGVPTRPIALTLIGNMILFLYVGIRVFMPEE